MEGNDTQRPRLVEAGALVGARYRIDRLIGSGGAGEVYEATDVRLHRQVAIKVIDPVIAGLDHAATRFVREARAMAAIESAHVVPIHDVGIDGPRLYIVQKLLSGVPLDRLMRAGRLPMAEVMPLACDVLTGLEALHGAGIVHRDIKPSNIFRLLSGRGMLLDLGIAVDEDAAHITERNLVLGTPEYMAPEHAVGRHAGPQSDLYAVGLVILFALGDYAGGPPASASLSVRLAGNAWLDRQMVEVPGPLRPSLRRALAYDPKHRFADAAEMRAALRVVPMGPRAPGPVTADLPTGRMRQLEPVTRPSRPIGRAQSPAPATLAAAPPAATPQAPSAGRKTVWPWSRTAVLACVVVASYLIWRLAMAR